jgi:hypothetical protein
MIQRRRHRVRAPFALAALLAAIGLAASGARAGTTCPQVRVCIAIDGSGSISAANFSLMKTGLADAVADPAVVPQNGTVELSFIQFGTSVVTHVAPTLVDSQATASGIANVLLNIPKDDGGTNMSGAVDQCASLIAGGPCASASRQVINVVTDGEPNSIPDTVTARNAAIGAGIDEINAEAVAAPESAVTFLRDQLAYPQPGYEAPPFTGPGFVIRTDSFEDFADAVRGKIGQIIGPKGCSIEPPSATNPIRTNHAFTVTVRNADGSPASGVTVNASITAGPNAGLSGSAATGAAGQVIFNYDDSQGPGTDTIEASGMVEGEAFSCTATKTWATQPPPCQVVPASDTNPVNTQHTVTGVFTHADGSAADGVPVSIVISGPNGPIFADGATNASGQITFSYQGGNTTGTDTIEFSGFVDGFVVTCSGTKTWFKPLPSCSAAPASGVNDLGDEHEITVTVRHGSGALASGVRVTAEILSGPNAGLSGAATTDGTGTIVVRDYTSDEAGTDTFRFSGTVDGEAFACQATKTWLAPPPPCTVTPASDTNPVGSPHTVTATFRHGDGSVASGVPVSVSITAGPNAPLFGDAVTTAAGQVVFTYTGGASAGTDTIQFAGVVDGHTVSCTAHKTWEIPPPPCTVNPASATNLVGTAHAVTATFRHANGSVASGVPVSVSITAGPNAPLLADAVTTAAGLVTFTYTGGANAGTDTIRFAGQVDGYPVSCTAQKTWEIPPPPCTVDPATATNPVRSSHAVTATFRRGNGSAAAGVPVSVIIAAGPNALRLADAVSNGSGQVTFSYEGGPNAGTDSIDFAAIVDGYPVRCQARKTWVVPPPPCAVSPATDTNPVGSAHTVVASFRRGDGSAAAGVPVSVSIPSGPNGPLFADAVADADGRVVFTYTGDSGTGTDTITFSAAVDDAVVSCQATKTWGEAQPSCTVDPGLATNRAGTEHTVVATFRRGSGAPAADAPVSVSITAGPNGPLLGDAIADANGRVVFSYTGGPTAGTDLLEFAGVVDGRVVTCRAAKTWVANQPTCSLVPIIDQGPVGTAHTVTATFTRATGTAAAAAPVSVIIASGPNALRLADAIADGAGRVPFTYTGGPNPGTDVIDFAAFIDGQLVTCTAVQTWLAPPPPCTVDPAVDVNAVGTSHTVTATFRRGDGSPAVGAPTSVAITAGPNSLLLADAVSDAGGRVAFTYTGGPRPGTDAIEFAAVYDDEVVTCRGSKTWVAAAPSCTVSPSLDANLTGDSHRLVATFRRGTGAAVTALPVSIGIVAGPNAPLFADAVSDAFGRVAFTYTGGPTAGTDVVEFAASIDGTVVRCAAAKIWVAGQPTCQVFPAAATNLIGARHTVTAVFRRGNGALAAALPVSVSIPSGPNGPLFADAVSDNAGRVAFSYTGTGGAGTDAIDFSAFLDGRVVSCRAIKTWVGARPTCEVFPAADVNLVGSPHTTAAVFRRGNGAAAAGLPVSVSIPSGPNALVLADAVTDGAGRVAFTYTGGQTPGTDVIEFAAFLDGEVVRCAATKTWAVGQPTCSVAPDAATNLAGTRHDVTATFRRGNGQRAPGASVSIAIVTGPNATLLADAVTNASGQVTFGYTGAQRAGTDLIEFAGVVDGQVVRCAATKTWRFAAPTCTAVPATASNPVGSRHTVTATFRRGDGANAAGVDVSASITAGPNAGLTADAITNASGQMALSYTGAGAAGTDTIAFRGYVDGQLATCSAGKTWVDAPASCDLTPTVATNRTGTPHTVTAVFRRADGTLAAGVTVSLNVLSGPNAPRQVTAVTNATGQAAFTYTGGATAGVDVLELRGRINGRDVSCRGTKTWVANQSTCDVVPAGAVRPVGSERMATAVFRAADGSPIAGAQVAASITSGPNAPLVVNGTTDASGQVVLSYTGGARTGTDVIAVSSVVAGQAVSCRASTDWVAGAATCDTTPTVAVNPVGSEHAVNAVFRHGDGSLAAGVAVSIAITAGPNAPRVAAATTNATGQTDFRYTGATTGTDTIQFSGQVDGQIVRCSAAKTWEPAGVPTRTATATATRTATRTLPPPSGTPTATPATGTPTATSATGTPTATPATGSPTATPTATGPLGPCVGDCNGDRMVVISELIVGVNIALGEQLVSNCLPFDPSGSGAVEINELIIGVSNALNGCPAGPTATPTPTSRTPSPTAPTPTPTRQTPTPSRTPGMLGEVLPVAGGSTALVNGVSAVAGVVAAVINGIELSGASFVLPSDEGVGGPAGACPLGGTATRTGSFPFVTVTLTNCALATADGSVTFNGTARVQLTSVTADVDIQYRVGAAAGLHITAELGGTLSPTLGGSCFLTAATLAVDAGEIVVNDPASQRVTMTLDGTDIAVGNLSFTADCLPTRYRLTFNGPLALGTGAAGPIHATADDLAVDVDARTAPASEQVSGAMASSCFGGTVTLATETDLVLTNSSVCPNAGTLLSTIASRTDAIAFRSGGAVDIDAGNDDTIDQSLTSCVDPALFTCGP